MPRGDGLKSQRDWIEWRVAGVDACDEHIVGQRKPWAV